jgi:hypothetical protein
MGKSIRILDKSGWYVHLKRESVKIWYEDVVLLTLDSIYE